jgi:hypothetical protein
MSTVAKLRVKSAAEIFDEMTANDPTFKARQELRKRQSEAHELDTYMAAQKLAADKAAMAKRGGYRKLSTLLTERTTVDWLIRDFVEAGVIALFAGPAGSYKSALVNDVAMRVALSGKPVFILSPEGSGLQRRLQGWLDEFAPFESAAALPLYVRDRRLNLSAAEEMRALITWLEEIETETGKPIAFIAIDTWSKATGHDESDNTETKLLLGEIDRHLRHRTDKAATVAIVCHTGHTDQSRARGASALTADTDAAYVVSFKNGTVCVTRERFKDSPALPPLYFKPKPRTLDYTDGAGVKQSSVVLMPAERPGIPAKRLTDTQQELLDHVVAVIGDKGLGVSFEAIRGGLDVPKGDLERRLSTLVSRGVLMCAEKLYSVPAPVVAGESSEGF